MTPYLIFQNQIKYAYHNKILILLFWLYFLEFSTVSAQETIMKGKVRDADTGEALPFVNVYLKGTTVGTSTDFKGNYLLRTSNQSDSLVASYVGYFSKARKIKPGVEQVIDFDLKSELIQLDEVVVLSGENPAFPIMREVMKNKKKHDKRSLNSYEFESYNKVEFDIAQLTKNFQKLKLVKKVKAIVDSIGDFSQENGQSYIPIFLSETQSRYYVRNRPELKKEEILKTKITGIGIERQEELAQFTGVSLQEYNFYANWLNILGKDFVSPIAHGWKTFYHYELMDSAMIDGDYCYRIDFEPKVEGDMAFYGYMWITKDQHALKSIEVETGDKINLNFVEDLHIYQELHPTNTAAWLPRTTKIEINLSELLPSFTGFRAKFFIMNRDWKVNARYPPSFYILPMEVKEDAAVNSEDYWDKIRPVPLTQSEVNTIGAINAVKDIPGVKTIADLTRTFQQGYYERGKLDLGPVLYVYAHNNIEGHRFRVGVRTNDFFSKKWVLAGYTAYGTKDQEFKYGAFVDFIPSHKPWTRVFAGYKHDIEQLGSPEESLNERYLFSTAARFGTLASPHRLTQYKVGFERDLLPGITQTLTLKHEAFEPLFPFAYNEENTDNQSILRTDYRNTSMVFETRIAKGENFYISNNYRKRMEAIKAPVVTFRYTLGLGGMLDSDFDYHKFVLGVNQRVNVGLLGTFFYQLEGGFIPSTLPYTLLENHQGNNTIFYNPDASNLMRFGEFASDTYVSLNYRHYFEGFILNRIPLMKRLKWRFVAAASAIYGTLSDENKALVPEFGPSGEPLQPVVSLDEKPYVEVGYGVENVLKVFTFMAFHRVTYADVGNNFGIRMTIAFKP